MFRTVRKKQNEICAEAAKQLLHTARRGILAVNGDDGYPYAIPINYFYDEVRQTICFHGSAAGHKADALKACDKVCFTVCGNEQIKEKVWAPYVQSAVVFGRCRPVADRETALALLRQFAGKYYPSEELIEAEISHSGNAVRMYEIQIEHLRGKEVQEK